MNKVQRGFTTLELLLCIIILAIIGFTGYHVYQSKQQTDKLLNSAQNETSAIKISKQRVTLKFSSLSFEYNNNSWTLDHNKSEDDQTCGKSDSAAIENKDNPSLFINFDVNDNCEKDGNDCSGYQNCSVESKQIATVKLSNSETKYILASRVSTDQGLSWKYSIEVSDTTSCKVMPCEVTVSTNPSNPSVISADYSGEGNLPGDPKSLSDFINIPTTQSAIAVLKTLHYE